MTKTFILKVASRCNLNCSYCYMYNMGDDTYLSQPKFMSMAIITAFAEKLKCYCKQNSMNDIYVCFHGGEPLLIDKQFYIDTVTLMRDKMTGIRINFVMQTNGTLLDEEWCILLKDLDIQIGISIDGPEKYHDEFRVYHNNRGSFKQVENAVKLRNDIAVGGLISVINIQIPPQELYDLYKNLTGKRMNILLPDGHYDNLPPKFDLLDSRNTPYADWLIELYELWKDDKTKKRPNITFFTNIIGIILGYPSGDELIGRKECGVMVLETNGTIEVIDPLRICGNGFTKTNYNILHNELSDMEDLPLYNLYYNSHNAISETCEKCLIKDICGGGYLPHRYSKKNGFNNPSVFCKDLIKIITHIQNDIFNNLPNDLLNQLDVEIVSYDDCLFALNKESVDFNIVRKELLESFKSSFVELNVIQV